MKKAWMLGAHVLLVVSMGACSRIPFDPREALRREETPVALHSETPASCGSEHRAFDYMIGEWRVVQTRSGKDFAENRVERIHAGCAVRENLQMRDGTLGTATSFYDATEKLWHTFYHGSDGFYAHLTGVTGPDGTQELTADVRLLPERGRVRKARQVTSKDAAGRPHQIGHVMNDHGNWQVIYDITFCPADQPSGERKPPC